MLNFRRFLVPVTAAWLLLHVTGTTIVVLGAGSSASEIVCTCAHGNDHGSCPMHGRPKDSARCRLQSTHNDLAMALLSMVGPLTLPSTSTSTIALVSAAIPSGYDTTLPIDWTVPPDPPPPRR